MKVNTFIWNLYYDDDIIFEMVPRFYMGYICRHFDSLSQNCGISIASTVEMFVFH